MFCSLLFCRLLEKNVIMQSIANDLGIEVTMVTKMLLPKIQEFRTLILKEISDIDKQVVRDGSGVGSSGDIHWNCIRCDSVNVIKSETFTIASFDLALNGSRIRILSPTSSTSERGGDVCDACGFDYISNSRRGEIGVVRKKKAVEAPVRNHGSVRVNGALAATNNNSRSTTAATNTSAKSPQVIKKMNIVNNVVNVIDLLSPDPGVGTKSNIDMVSSIVGRKRRRSGDIDKSSSASTADSWEVCFYYYKYLLLLATSTPRLLQQPSLL